MSACVGMLNVGKVCFRGGDELVLIGDVEGISTAVSSTTLGLYSDEERRSFCLGLDGVEFF